MHIAFLWRANLGLSSKIDRATLFILFGASTYNYNTTLILNVENTLTWYPVTGSIKTIV